MPIETHKRKAYHVLAKLPFRWTSHSYLCIASKKIIHANVLINQEIYLQFMDNVRWAISYMSFCTLSTSIFVTI